MRRLAQTNDNRCQSADDTEAERYVLHAVGQPTHQLQQIHVEDRHGDTPPKKSAPSVRTCVGAGCTRLTASSRKLSSAW